MAYLQEECSILLQYNKEGLLVVKGDGVIKIDLHFFRSSNYRSSLLLSSLL